MKDKIPNRQNNETRLLPFADPRCSFFYKNSQRFLISALPTSNWTVHEKKIVFKSKRSFRASQYASNAANFRSIG